MKMFGGRRVFFPPRRGGGRVEVSFVPGVDSVSIRFKECRIIIERRRQFL